MTDEQFLELVKREEEERERNWDPRKRWQVIEQTIEWVDSQQPVPRNSRQARLAIQAKRAVGVTSS